MNPLERLPTGLAFDADQVDDRIAVPHTFQRQFASRDVTRDALDVIGIESFPSSTRQNDNAMSPSGQLRNKMLAQESTPPCNHYVHCFPYPLSLDSLVPLVLNRKHKT